MQGLLKSKTRLIVGASNLWPSLFCTPIGPLCSNCQNAVSFPLLALRLVVWQINRAEARYSDRPDRSRSLKWQPSPLSLLNLRLDPFRDHPNYNVLSENHYTLIWHHPSSNWIRYLAKQTSWGGECREFLLCELIWSKHSPVQRTNQSVSHACSLTKPGRSLINELL